MSARTTWYWVVDERGACGAVVVNDDGVVVDCAPIWRRHWKGRPATGFPYKKARRIDARPEKHV